MALKTNEGLYIKVEPLTEKEINYIVYSSEETREKEKNGNALLNEILQELEEKENDLRNTLELNYSQEIEEEINRIVSFKRDCKTTMRGGDIFKKDVEGNLIIPMPPLDGISFTEKQIKEAICNCYTKKIQMSAMLKNDATASGAYNSFKTKQIIPGNMEDC